MDICANPETGLFTISFTDVNKKHYKATMKHFQKFCGGEQLVLGRGAGRQEVLVSFFSREAALKALYGGGEEEGFLGLEVVKACRP